jgi:hypothetical protein
VVVASTSDTEPTDRGIATCDAKVWPSISTTISATKKERLFRPGVLSRICCLGPCDDLQGCEAVPIWPLRWMHVSLSFYVDIA